MYTLTENLKAPHAKKASQAVRLESPSAIERV